MKRIEEKSGLCVFWHVLLSYSLGSADTKERSQGKFNVHLRIWKRWGRVIENFLKDSLDARYCSAANSMRGQHLTGSFVLQGFFVSIIYCYCNGEVGWGGPGRPQVSITMWPKLFRVHGSYRTKCPGGGEMF